MAQPTNIHPSDSYQYVAPVEKTITVISGTKAGNGDNELIAADASKTIVISSVVLQNESATATTMILYDGASTDNKPLLRCLGQNQGDGIAIVFQSDARRKGTKGKSLVLNLSGANSCGYTIGYYTE